MTLNDLRPSLARVNLDCIQRSRIGWCATSYKATNLLIYTEMKMQM